MAWRAVAAAAARFLSLSLSLVLFIRFLLLQYSFSLSPARERTLARILSSPGFRSRLQSVHRADCLLLFVSVAKLLQRVALGSVFLFVWWKALTHFESNCLSQIAGGGRGLSRWLWFCFSDVMLYRTIWIGGVAPKCGASHFSSNNFISELLEWFISRIFRKYFVVLHIHLTLTSYTDF